MMPVEIPDALVPEDAWVEDDLCSRCANEAKLQDPFGGQRELRDVPPGIDRRTARSRGPFA